jgi:hypothetical protein
MHQGVITTGAMAFESNHQVKNVPRKKYLYQYDFEEAQSDDDLMQDYAAEFEQPKGRRQSKKQANSRRKRHMGDFY